MWKFLDANGDGVIDSEEIHIFCYNRLANINILLLLLLLLLLLIIIMLIMILIILQIITVILKI